MTLKFATAAGLQSVTAGVEFPSVTGVPTIETSVGVRTAGTGFRLAPGATKQLQHTNTYGSAGDKIYQFYFWVVTAPAANRNIFSIDNGSAQKIAFKLTTGLVPALQNQEEDVQIGTDGPALSTGHMYRLAIRINDTTLSATTVEARLYDVDDETTIIWNPSGTIDLAAAPNRMSFANRNDANLDWIFTDVEVLDVDATAPNDWPGPGSIGYLRPNGNGASSQWAGSDGNSTDNYLLLDETPPNGVTDYIQSNTSGQIDDWTLTDTPAGVNSDDVIDWVAPGVYFAISNITGGDPDAVVGATLNGNLSESGNISGAGATTYLSYQTTPAQTLPLVITTAGLTKAHLDAATGRVRETVTDTHFIRVSAYWLMYKHSPAVGGDTELVVADATHDHTAENIALTQAQVLVVADSEHAHASEEVALTQAQLLAVSDATHAHTADNLDLTQAQLLEVQEAAHAHAVDNLDLVQAQLLAVADAAHAHTVENVDLSTSILLTVQDASHAHTAENLDLIQAAVLEVQEAAHAHAAQTVSLIFSPAPTPPPEPTPVGIGGAGWPGGRTYAQALRYYLSRFPGYRQLPWARPRRKKRKLTQAEIEERDREIMELMG